MKGEGGHREEEECLANNQWNNQIEPVNGAWFPLVNYNWGNWGIGGFKCCWGNFNDQSVFNLLTKSSGKLNLRGVCLIYLDEGCSNWIENKLLKCWSEP